MSGLTRRTFVGAALASAGCVPLTLGGIQRAVSASIAPPSVLQPGTRMVWIGGAASIPAERSQLELDYNGIWRNKRTGERYSQFDTPGAAGAGFVVADVLVAEPRGFLLWVAQLQINPAAGGATSFTDFDGMVSTAQNIRDFWISPAYLTELKDRDDPESRVLHMPYTLDERTYRAVRIQTKNGDAWSQNTYHLDTGLCLVAASTVQGKAVHVLGLNNMLESGAGSTQVSYFRIAGIRQTGLPGPGASYPDALRRLRRMSYSGTASVVVGAGGVRPQTFPIRIDYNIASNAGTFLVARKSVSGTPELQDRVIPAGVIGSLWMNPDTLARHSAGQMLDRDPLTGVETVSAGRQGNLALIVQRTRLARCSYGYDLGQGFLTRAELQTRTGIATKIIVLQLAGTQ